MNGAALTMKTNFYNLAETTYRHIFLQQMFCFFSVVFELLIATFQVFLFNSVGCFVRSDNYEIHSTDYRRKYI